MGDEKDFHGDDLGVSDRTRLLHQSAGLAAQPYGTHENARNYSDLAVVLPLVLRELNPGLSERTMTGLRLISAVIGGVIAVCCFLPPSYIAGSAVATDGRIVMINRPVQVSFLIGLPAFSLRNAAQFYPNGVLFLKRLPTTLRLSFRQWRAEFSVASPRKKTWMIIRPVLKQAFWNLPLWGMLAASVEAAASGVFDAYNKYGESIIKIPEWLAIPSTYISATHSNGWVMSRQALASNFYRNLTGIRRYCCFAPCGHRLYRKGLMLNHEQANHVFYLAKNSMEAMRVNNLKGAIEVVDTFALLMSSDAVRSAAILKLNTLLGVDERLTDTLSELLFAHMALYHTNTFGLDNMPNAILRVGGVILKTLLAIGPGVLGPFSNLAAGMDQPGGLSFLVMVIAVSSYALNLIINIKSSIGLPSFVDEAFIRKFIEFHARKKGNEGYFKQPWFWVSVVADLLKFVSVAATAYYLGVGIYGVTVEMASHISFLEGSEGLYSLLAAMSAGAQAANAANGLSGIIDGLIAWGFKRHYNKHIETHLGHLKSWIMSCSHRTAAARASIDWFIAHLDRYQRVLSRMTSSEFDEFNHLMADVYGDAGVQTAINEALEKRHGSGAEVLGRAKAFASSQSRFFPNRQSLQAFNNSQDELSGPPQAA